MALLPATLAPLAHAASGDVLWTSDWAYSATEDTYLKVVPGGGGSVVAVGQGDAGWDFKPRVVVVKYAADGSADWSFLFDGSLHEGARGGALAVDAQGAVIVGAHNQMTTTQDGLWLLRKYSAGGSALWSIAPDVSTGGEGIADIEVDANGDVYVAGDTGTTPDRLLLIKYSGLDGSEIWRRAITPRGRVWVHDLVVDAAGNAYVAGAIEQAGDAVNCLFARWNAAGELSWERTWDGGHDRDDQLSRIALKTGSRGTWLYVGGFYGVGDDHQHAVVLRYRTSGVRIWEREFAYATGGPTDTSGITVDGRGGVAAIADFDARTPLLRRAWLTKWTAGGTRQWKTAYPGLKTKAKTGANFYSLVGDASGRLWCGGGTSLEAWYYPHEWFVARYRADGTRVWLRRWYPDPGEKGAVCTLVCRGGDDALFAAGYTVTDATSFDFAMRRYER
jgi:hypothetical protein